MHSAERVILWSAVVVLFILYLWPGQSGYIGRKITFMEMREFDKVPEDLQKVYQENALRFADALGETMDKTWNEVSAENKPKVIAKFTESVTKVIETMKAAKKVNGNDAATQFLTVSVGVSNKAEAEEAGRAAGQPGARRTENTTSKYMPDPSMFFPMTSGFSLDDTLNSVKSTIESVPKTSGYSFY
ncbi:hypothetical protein [Yellowstone lake phycodnavirus 2]|uniref:hypothetical protein n=1 Tax=Yellowstone lake phycodnavirus 2 TaxID=1586714 RepID=UPI0006EB355C|nr:hypothetical protein AR678_gp098 [Yellowstone lake phycodnavirus 2]BAT22372.1 hypothetical protein [Yellowstone lake phycodnavirus 2]